MRPNLPVDAKRVVGYVRASTEDQHLEPEPQRDALKRWCTANRATRVAVYNDLGVSGGSPLDMRPGLSAAVDALRTQEAGVFLIAKGDQIARDVVVSAIVERLVERLRAAWLSIRAIAKRLNQKGIACLGKRWDATTVARLLKGTADVGWPEVA